MHPSFFRKAESFQDSPVAFLSKLFDMWGSFHPISFGREHSIKAVFNKVGIAGRNYVIVGVKRYFILSHQ